MKQVEQFIPLNIAILTISDSRLLENDQSGDMLAKRIIEAGHLLAERKLDPDDQYQIRLTLSKWIVDSEVDVVLTTGGTGLTGRDNTPEAVKPLLDKEIDGFGELFRMLSFKHIKTSTMQSRALAGTANGTFIFCLPGSPGACKDSWDLLLKAQLDHRTKPCNLAMLIPRLRE